MSFQKFGEVIKDEVTPFQEFGEAIEDKGAPQEFGELAEESADEEKTFLQTFKDLMEEREQIVPGMTKHKALGILRGIGSIAQEVSGRMVTPEQIREEMAATETLEPEELEEEEAGKTFGEFVGAFAVPAGPSKLLKKLPKGIKLTKRQIPLANFLRKYGFTDREMTLFLQHPKKVKTIGLAAQKGEKTANLLYDMQKKTGNIIETLKEKGKGGPSLPLSEAINLFEDLHEKYKKIPRVFRESVLPDARELMKSNFASSDLIQFIQNINARIGNVKGGKAAIGILKGPIKEYLKELNPALAKDYFQANELYAKGARLSKKLAPHHIETYIREAEIFGVAKGIFEMDFKLLRKILGYSGARILAREMLINPKMQNLTLQLRRNLNTKNKKNLSKLLIQIFRNVKKTEEAGYQG